MSIEGIKEGEQLDKKEAEKLRKDTEFYVIKVITGSKSGLRKETVEELARLYELFDVEVHGDRLSMAGMTDWMQGRTDLPVLPKFEETQFALFSNRFCEIF